MRRKTHFIVVMGVSGSGKTTLGVLLAERLGWRFVEGDDLHPLANIEKMRNGLPLNDEDRAPWLVQISENIARMGAAGESCVLTCSALKRKYREKIQGARTDILFVYLKGSRTLLEKQLSQRLGHFMPSSLLETQFDALEEPLQEEEPVLTILLGRPPEVLLEEILADLVDCTRRKRCV